MDPPGRLEKIFDLASRLQRFEVETHPVDADEYQSLTGGELMRRVGDVKIRARLRAMSATAGATAMIETSKPVEPTGRSHFGLRLHVQAWPALLRRLLDELSRQETGRSVHLVRRESRRQRPGADRQNR